MKHSNGNHLRFIFRCFLILSCIYPNLIIAQAENDYPGFIGVSLGSSIPLGDYSSKDADNETAGWANPGAVFDVSFGYKLGAGKVGLCALLRGQANYVDAQSYANALASQVAGVNWSVQGGYWGMGGFLFGGFGSLQVSETVLFEPRVMLGFLNASNPEITISVSGPGGSYWIKQNSTSARSFAYLVGGGLRFNIGKRMSLLTNLDYMAAQPEFINVQLLDSDGNLSSDSWSQEIVTLNLSAGLAIRL
jgi:hypothetical protein